MHSALCEAYALGDFSPWGRLLLNEWQSEGVLQLSFESNVGSFCKSAENKKEPMIVLLENGPTSQPQLMQLRACSAPLLILWMGKQFNKEDVRMGLTTRVYALLENPTAGDKRTQDIFIQAKQTLDRYLQLHHLLHSMKGLVLQSESKNTDADLIRELKVGISKLERMTHNNPWWRSEQNEGTPESSLPVAQFQGLGDVLLTLGELERTGTLWVRGGRPGEEGKIDFIQGKMTVAEAGAVSQLKAVYRMFCWENSRFLFNRKNPEDCRSQKMIAMEIEEIVREGQQQQERTQKIKKEIPPAHIKLDLVAAKMTVSTAFTPADFYTLIQVAQFHHVSDILDYSEKWDVEILEGLIHLRKAGYIHLVA